MSSILPSSARIQEEESNDQGQSLVEGMFGSGGRRRRDAEPEEEEEEEEGYHSFRPARHREAKGVLYRIDPMKGELKERVTRYVQGGIIDKDLRFAREVFGLVNTSGRRDFDAFWESPWLEEHVRDTTRKRKRDEDQRTMAVRSFIRATTATGGEEADVGRFIETVDRLTQWEDRHGSKDIVKTVSRTVQSFERATLSAVSALLRTHHCNSTRGRVRPLIEPREEEGGDVPCTLRRSDLTFHAFAAAVAMEMQWSEATSGARNTTIYLCKQIEERRKDACLRLVACLARLTPEELPLDRLGVPLMGINTSLCISRGVLVVMPGATSATYILDIDEGMEDLANARTIRITRTVRSEEADAAAAVI